MADQVIAIKRPMSSVLITGASSYFSMYDDVVRNLPYREIERVASELHRAYKEERNVFLFGNGGSAALASHFACDLGKGAAPEHGKRFRVFALTDNIPLMTAWANDSSYEQIFAEQMQNLVQPGDLAVAISGSGRSPNVLRALELGRKHGTLNIGLTGFEGGHLPALCDICVIVPSNNMQIIEDLHLGVAHALFTIVRNRILHGTAATETVDGLDNDGGATGQSLKEVA